MQADGNQHKRRRPARWLGLLLLAAPLACPMLAQAQGGKPLTADDIAWLRRDGFGLDTATIQRYQELGRTRFLDEQLAGGDDPLPPAVAPLINSYEVFNTSPAKLVADYRDEQQKVKDVDAADANAKEMAKKDFQKYRRDLYKQSAEVELLRAIYGRNQLKEQMVWFWLNHFSVYAPKGGVGLFTTDYEENVIRPHALGKFKDLVMATLESPAMQLYLDNAHNVRGKTNENYARELMELHTLGVNSGYTQQDVQQLSLILTGAGVIPQRGPNVVDGIDGSFLNQRPGVIRNGLFVFLPGRHDFSDKQFLGHDIKGSGFDEIAQAVNLIVQQPACATFVSRQIAQYFVSDDPPPALVDAMAKTFQRTDGDIAAVLRTMFLSKYITVGNGKKFKDPTQFLVSAMRLSYDGKPITDADPLVNWLNQMTELVYGHITPDGWALDSTSWSSSGQMAKRFDVARAIGSGRNRLFADGDGQVTRADPPMLNSALFQQTIEPTLSDATRDALGKATSQVEWNTFLLSSPDFNYR
ncbi:DUF1800 domain-containing protein [Dyella psychrodurans]|uniref:DUF1800 domain-containing protein n=1 Tax=Dyella psychrodurans TaxID=1927960 RepID=A0A370XDY6_9GAMM|nr:DUF1800 domain-containing protein [Dyella psychrodurans]RDS86644.1 DUF1800 domain-containing protein [Dyella psychrodurans]